MATAEPCKFNKSTSVKLPRSAAYIYDNLVQFNDPCHKVSYYAIINGFEVWIIKHSNPEKLRKTDKSEPIVDLRKVPYDKLDSVSCVKWCKFNAASSFVVCTQTGIIHVYDFDAKKILYSHDIILDSPTNNAASNNSLNPTINCVDSNGKDKLFVGLSNGLLLSFDVDTNGLSNKKCIYRCDNSEAINCLSRPTLTNYNANKNNKIFIGCDDGSVIQYDFYSSDIDVLIEKSDQHKIFEEKKEPFDADKLSNKCGACICISACDDFVAAGYSSGHIKIVQKSELSFAIKQIAMHRRMVTSIAILEDSCLIATASEDGFYHVIRNSSSSVDVIRSGSFENSMLIGIKFVQNKAKHETKGFHKDKDKMILLTAYDRNRVVFV